MADTIDVLIHFSEENWTQFRQHENERATISNLIIIIAAAISGVVTQTGFNKNSLLLTILLIALGVYGVIITVKFYVQSQYYLSRARALGHQLDKLCPDAEIDKLITEADKKYNRQYPILVRRLPVWFLLHILITLLGIVFTVRLLLF
jgi:hypothetical protein